MVRLVDVIEDDVGSRSVRHLHSKLLSSFRNPRKLLCADIQCTVYVLPSVNASTAMASQKKFLAMTC
jgi:hypothetical protein